MYSHDHNAKYAELYQPDSRAQPKLIQCMDSMSHEGSVKFAYITELVSHLDLVAHLELVNHSKLVIHLESINSLELLDISELGHYSELPDALESKHCLE